MATLAILPFARHRRIRLIEGNAIYLPPKSMLLKEFAEGVYLLEPPPPPGFCFKGGPLILKVLNSHKHSVKQYMVSNTH
jgi:hypothetical protein